MARRRCREALISSPPHELVAAPASRRWRHVRRIPHPPMYAMDSAPALRSYHTDLCNSELRVLPLSGLPIRLFSRGKLSEIGQQFVDDPTVRATSDRAARLRALEKCPFFYRSGKILRTQSSPREILVTNHHPER